MTHRLLRTPGALALRGAAALAFGTATLAWPSMTVADFVALFAGYAVVDGAAGAAAALRLRRRGADGSAVRDPLFLLGVGGAALGVVAAAWDDVSMQALLALLALWAAAAGAGHLYVVTGARRRPAGWWLLGGAGAAALALAAVVVLALAVGDVRVGREVGAYGVAAGALLLGCAARVRFALSRAPRRRVTDAPADAAVVLPRGAEAAPET